MYAVFSTAASESLSLSLSLSSSENACRRFLSVGECACVRKSHARSLPIVERIEMSIARPLASLSVLPITVDRPMSWRARELGIPVLLLSFTSSEVKARHSGRLSCALSDITRPQFLQMSSPDSGSVTVLPLLHILHIIAVCIFSKMRYYYYRDSN